MLRRLSGHRDVILEAGAENYYPAKGFAPILNLLLYRLKQFRDWCIRWLNAPYRFLAGPL